MKNLSIFLIITFGLFVTSCKKEEQLPESSTTTSTGGGSSGGSSTFTNEFRAKIDGVNLSYSSLRVNNILFFDAFAEDAPSSLKGLGIKLPKDVTPGTYSLTANGNQYGYYNPTNSQNTDSYTTLWGSGSITVISHNTTNQTIEATFNFVGKQQPPLTGQINVTDGYFKLKY